MSQPNRSLQAKAIKARAQRVEASIRFRTLAPVAVLPDVAPRFYGAKTWEQAKPLRQA